MEVDVHAVDENADHAKVYVANHAIVAAAPCNTRSGLLLLLLLLLLMLL